MFAALAAVGVPPAQADELVSQLEAGAAARAYTWISESSAPHGSEPRFENGWAESVRTVVGDLLRIADTTAAQRGRAAPSALLLASKARHHPGR
ncbi:hypothetical protein ACFWSF_26470 [Streptomyces sp. NPDC058611]|uniref:hypothetical protein n=1 Tax=unclassified Streptomyces TaxID=2593676 RepID=UPI0036469CF0